MKKLRYLTLLIVVFGFTNASEKGSGYEVGDIVANFKLKNIDGKMIAMSDYKKVEGLIVIFTCNTCPYSKLYEDRIIALHNNYSKKGFPVVAINSNDPIKQVGDSYQKMKERADYKNFSFPYLFDATQQTAKAFGATRTPHVYLLTKEHTTFKVAYIGAIDNNHQSPEEVTEHYVENAIAEVKSGKNVSRNFTKAIGCTIKWK